MYFLLFRHLYPVKYPYPRKKIRELQTISTKIVLVFILKSYILNFCYNSKQKALKIWFWSYLCLSQFPAMLKQEWL